LLPRIAARISLVLLGLMFLLPFLNPYHFYPLTNFYTEWLALALGLVALLPLLVKRFWDEIEVPTLVLWLLGFAALQVLQIFVLDIAYAELSLLGALYVIWAGLLVWLGRILAQSCSLEQVAVVLATMLLLGGLLNAAAAALQCSGVSPLPQAFIARLVSAGRAYGNFGQANHYSDYMTLALFSALYLQIKGRLSWFTAAVAVAILMYALSLAGSRSTWLYLLGALALSLWFRFRSDEPALRRAVLTLAGLLALFTLFQYGIGNSALPTGACHLSLTAGARVVAELADVFAPEMGVGSDAQRLYMWHHALLMWFRHPMLGVGFGQYAGVFFEQAAELSHYRIPGYGSHAHNALAQLLAETGLVGAGLVCAGLGGWLLGLRRRISATAEHWWMLCLLTVLFLHSMIEYPLWYSNFLGVAAVLLGMGSHRVIRLRLTALSRYAFPVMLAAGFFTLGSALQAYRDLELLMYPRVLPKDREEIVRHNEALLKLHSDTLLAPYVELTYAGIIVADRSNLEDKLALSQRVLRLRPVPDVAYRLVLLRGLNGEQGAALAQLERAVAVFPGWLKAFVPLAEKAAQQETAALGVIAAKASEKLKQVDRNGG